MMRTLLIVIFLLVICGSLMAQDSALVRIRLDVDQAELDINGQKTEFDSFGNKLTKDSWFILHLETGEYQFSLTSLPFIKLDTTIVFTSNQTFTWDLRLTTRPVSEIVLYETKPENVEVVQLDLFSDPDSCEIYFNGVKQSFMSPKTIYMNPGMYKFQMDKDGYEPLTADIDLRGFQKVTATFKPMISQPEPVTAEKLGLVYVKQQPLLDINEAKKTKDMYSSLAESFLIFPLSQGILARLVVDDNQEKAANIMVGTGVVLTLGSYILSKVMFKKKHNQIMAENEKRRQDNTLAKEANKTNDRTVQDENDLLMQSWMADNMNRGSVDIIKE